MSFNHVFHLPRRGVASPRQIVGIVIFTFTGPVLASDYWEHNGGLTYFGPVRLQTLYIVACVGGAMSLPLFVNARNWLLAILPGALAGFGAVWMHVLYVVWAEPDSMDSGGTVFLALVGAAPGLLIYWLLSKLKTSMFGSSAR